MIVVNSASRNCHLKLTRMGYGTVVRLSTIILCVAGRSGGSLLRLRLVVVIGQAGDGSRVTELNS